MARPTKKVNKRSVVSRKKSRQARLNIVNRLRNSRVLIFVLMFAVVGTALVIRSLAQTNLPTDPKAIVAGYYKSKPTSIRADSTTGKYIYDSYSASQLVLADGTLLCDDGNAEGVISTGKLPRGQTAKLQEEIKALDIDTVADVIGDSTATDHISDNEGFVLATRSKVKAIDIRSGATKPDKLVKMQEKIQKACEKATDKAQRGSTPEFTIPTSSASASQSILNRLASAFSPKVSAAPPPPVYIKTAHADGLVTKINDYRAANGRRRLTRSACLNAVAGLQAKRMAEKATLYHNPILLSEFYYVCYGEGVRGNNPPTAPPSNWWYLGENVGVGGSSDPAGVFDAYKKSSGHNANMLAADANRIGSATYQSSVNNNYYTAQVFAAW